MKTKKIKILLIVFVVLFTALVTYLVGVPMVRTVKDPDQFRLWVQSNGIWSRLAFIAMSMTQIIIALIPGEPFEIAAGYAFGVWEGTVLCMIATLLGSAIIYALMHRFGMRFALLFFEREKLESLPLFHRSKRTNMIMFFLMVLPGTPKDLLSYAAGLTDIPFWTWMGIVAISRIPSLITSIIGGDALGSKKYVMTIVVFAATMAISGLGLWIYNWYCKRKQ